MRIKQKVTINIPRFVTTLGTQGLMQGVTLVVAVVLTASAVYAQHNVSAKQPVPKPTASTKTAPRHVSKQVAAATKTTPAAAPPAVAAVPAPKAVTPAPAPAKPAPKVVVAAPTSSVSGLKPTSGTSTSTSTSSSSTSTGTSTSTGSSTSNPPAQPIGYSSTNWSGYMATASLYANVTAAWVVPTVSGNGTSTSTDGIWIGIGGVTSGDLIQVGTEDTVSANGHVSTAAFYEMLPQAAVTIPGVTVSDGDSVTAAVTEVSAGSWTIAFTDVTSNKSYTISVSYASSNSSAEWIVEDPSYSNGRLAPLDTFGSVSFSGGTTTAQGSTLTIAGSAASPITMVSGSGQVVALPSSLTAVGDGFTVTQQ